MTTPAIPATQIAFITERMTNSTELKRLLRAVETTYYLCLFTQDHYAGNTDVWRDWARIGFATGLQQAPFLADPSDRLALSTFTNGKVLTFTATPGNAAAGSEWKVVLESVANLRSKVFNLSSADRSATLINTSGIGDHIGEPVDLAIAGLPTDERETILGARHHALASLTFPIIKQCVITEKAN